jgi:hypothetical protein
MNATSNWNNHAAACNFKLCSTLTQNQTFGQVYLGTTFKTDFDTILMTIAGELQTVQPDYKEDNILGISLSNWPNQ